MKLAVVNHWYDKKSAVFWNKDGFLKMLSVLRDREGWEVKFFKKHERTFGWSHDYVELEFSPDPVGALKQWKPDAVLVFADFASASLGELEGCGIPIAMCLTGGRFTQYAHVPDLVFTESKSYIDWMKSIGVKRVIQAFGTNTELFKPATMPKVWDGFFPATGAAWKRHWLFAEALKERGLVCGWWQPHEPQCLEVCIKNGCCVLHHQMPESLYYLYNMARTVVITSEDVGGSQRSVLEAMAMNIPVIVMADSTMTTEYVREAGEGAIVEPNIEEIRKAVDEWKDKKVNTREWILANYSEYIYADKVRDGILSIMK
jgi:glycosyltransferase involved in cell wall biosynthesis